MKNKRPHIILTIFSLVVFCTIALLPMGCYFVDPGYRAEVDEDAYRASVKREAEEQKAQKEEKQTEIEQTEAVEGIVEEGVEPIAGEIITYSGIVTEATVIIIVDFKTTEVSGSINLSGDENINATIDGKINISNYEVTAKYTGTGRLESEGEDYPVSGTITGTVTNDLGTLKGYIKSDYDDSGVEFTATK